MGGFRRVQMGGLGVLLVLFITESVFSIVGLGSMGGCRNENIYSQPPAGRSQAPHV